ncbi:LysR family transcriptional regulator [Phreatobacter stygius]|uniref:LysR family transcriptional regulator n=1 Tax=Phreatobacter stygius TaxID=1940610 RepID=A0A4D7AWX1_9HYPH|nr:LysR family transcriptional regulator [Phreatobacter stygius]QCI64541.1 LysR family transcriptional regulator [Phreatobacter stygius]
MKLNRRLIPDIRTLQAFECAARHLSFTQAAAELNLTQSAVSRQIRDLEAQLGVTLFERVRRRVVLSGSGQALLVDVRRLLRQTEETMARAMAAGRSTSTLNIATLPTFASRWLMPRLPAYLRDNPGTVLNLTSRSAPFNFHDEPFDLAIHHGQPIWAGATCRYLCDEWIVPVASPQVLAHHPVDTPAALASASLLHLATRPGLWAAWFQANGGEIEAAYRGHRFDQFAMIIEAAVAGLGVALLPRYLIEHELRSGDLQVVFDRPFETDSSYYLVVPEDGLHNPLTQAFCTWISAQVSPRRQPAESPAPPASGDAAPA